MGKVTGFETDRAEISGARQDIDAINAKVRELEAQLHGALSRQLGELSVALAGIKDIGALLEQLRALRGE